MSGREFILPNGTIVKEEDLTPEMREDIGIDENGNWIDEEEEYEEEYVSIDDIARGEGFWIDDDGHWRELDEEDDW